MPVLVTLALLLLLVVGSIAVTATRVAGGLAGSGGNPDAAVVEPARSGAAIAFGVDVA